MIGYKKTEKSHKYVSFDFNLNLFWYLTQPCYLVTSSKTTTLHLILYLFQDNSLKKSICYLLKHDYLNVNYFLIIWVNMQVTWLETDLFTVGLGFLMLSMGLTLTFEDFRRCLRNPWTVSISHLFCLFVGFYLIYCVLKMALLSVCQVGVGFLAQYLIKPVLGFFIAMVCDYAYGHWVLTKKEQENTLIVSQMNKMMSLNLKRAAQVLTKL